MKLMIYVFILNISITNISYAKKYRIIKNRPIDVITSKRLRDMSWDMGSAPLVSPIFHQKLDKITNSKISEKNKSMLLINGMMSYKTRYRLIKLAKKTIFFSVLSIHKDGKRKDPVITDIFTKKMVDGLISAKERGVEVIIIYDGLASNMAKSQKIIDKLRASKIEVIKYNPYLTQNRDYLGFIPFDIFNILRKLAFVSFGRKESLLKNRWHDKTILVDSKYAILGGLNWGERYALGCAFNAGDYKIADFLNHPLSREINLKEDNSPSDGWGKFHKSGWRDTDVLVAGPVVSSIQKNLLFDYLALKQGMKRKKFKYQYIQQQMLKKVHNIYKKNYQYNPRWTADKNNTESVGNLRVRYIAQRPFLYMDGSKNKELINEAKKNDLYINIKRPNAYITNFYINMINKAKHQILWGSFSLVPQLSLLKALEDSARRGVRIYIITNSKKTARFLGDKGIFTYRRNKKIYAKLLKKGRGFIRIFEWQDKVKINNRKLTSGTFHSKNMDIDGVVSIIGSYNISKASFNDHAESVLTILDPTFSISNQKMFQNDFKYTKEVILK